MARTINEKLRDERRKQILNAASVLFSQNGFSQSTVTQIAKLAGMSHAAIFLYFPSKEVLFHAVILEPLEEGKTLYKSLLSQGTTPLERLQNLVNGQIRRALHHATYLRLVQYALGQPDRFSLLAAELNTFVTEFVQDLIPVIEEGQKTGQLHSGDPYYIAWAYFSYMNGIGMCFLEPTEESITQLVKNGMRIFAPVPTGIYG